MSSSLSFFFPVLAAGDGFVIFIIVAIIYGIAKFVAFINSKTEAASSHKDGPPQDMGELIKRVLQQQKNQSQDPTYTTPKKRPEPRQKEVAYTQPAQRKSTPAPKLEPTSVYPDPFQKKAEPAPAPSEPVFSPQAAEAPPPVHESTLSSFHPLSSDDIEANVRRMSMDVTASAESSIQAAYSSASKSYEQTLQQLNKLKEEMTTKAAALPQAISQAVSPISFGSKEDLKNAVLMKEILDTPKGLR